MGIYAINFTPAEVFSILLAHIEAQGLELDPYGEVRIISYGKPKVIFHSEDTTVHVKASEFETREEFK
jgi:hypothetical protein